MWEKIVLNLLSNAFKFTFAGEITLRLETAGNQAQLTVRDTGVGIPAEELPRIFERFHRVKGSHGRTHEGSGIGLALVQELVRLHGGTIQVESTLNEGSRFTVALPLGNAHLDPRRLGGRSQLLPTTTSADLFVQEALRWLPGEEQPEQDEEWNGPAERDSLPESFAGNQQSGTARILWADDNADMRDYVRRLLGQRYEVEAVADGQAALEAARANPPTLILSDVMMPRLDGFGLLRALRQDPALQHIPVILLSARAGEEARIEGIEQGADDYLIKPFSARELLARVESQLRVARLQAQLSAELAERRQAEERLQKLNEELEQRVAERTRELARRNERLSQLANQLSEAEQWERRRLAKTLHDGLQQLLIAGKLQLSLLLSDGGSAGAAEDLKQVLDQAIEVSRSLTYELSPPALYTADLPAALQWLVRWFQSNYRFTVNVQGSEAFPTLPDHLKLFLFDAVRELLFNAVKHSEGTAATVQLLHPQPQQLCITVADDGQGFDPVAVEQDGNTRQGFGLFSIRERLAALGGNFQINATPGAGARFILTLPFSPDASPHLTPDT
jgi:signal transduction histidine kinase